MKKVYLIIIVILVTIFINSCNKSSSNIKYYLKSGTKIDIKAKDMMPNLDDLPEYESIQYQYTNKKVLMFESHSVVLVVGYDDQTYQSEKENLENQYTFLQEEIKNMIPEHEFSINSYTFRVVDRKENSNTEFPKSFGMIGTSEEEKSIAYLYFYDFDLDYIREEDDQDPMAHFIKTYFKYSF